MTNAREVADGVLFFRTMMVNVFIVRTGRSWVLVDAGLRGYARSIINAAGSYLGHYSPPSSIVLTHGHFDHVGSLHSLLSSWDVPVYAHALERPYLTGISPYPPPDPLVGGGGMALLSRAYPRGPIDLGSRLKTLPDLGRVEGMDDWQWIHTPGHTAGHVSLFRQRDGTLIAGDAVTTVQQESVVAVATQRREMHGPPAYFTQDWDAARESVRRLAALDVDVLATGHGIPLQGEAIRRDLRRLAAGFDDAERPSYGRYATRPAITDERGIVSLPPDPLPKVLVGVAAVVAATAWGVTKYRQRADGLQHAPGHGS